MVAAFHFPALKAELYCPKSPVLYSKQRVFVLSTNITFNYVLTLNQRSQKYNFSSVQQLNRVQNFNQFFHNRDVLYYYTAFV
ncbi:hypothetical protein MTHERMMSTA1_24930 [Methanosarcina thermophila MST-A1]|uniref:Uncharacterized protein n=1 Tax=Methanosarcina thermophila TaxID=2210 RepID=A0A3G9CVD1_METTE|nr:putative conserved hypothetical protein [Methanosarcina thermophila]GLI15367.1 hypothetical protein MTHERMMSTA1_24930 [Methanosarcina thermophila MST-A1]